MSKREWKMFPAFILSGLLLFSACSEDKEPEFIPASGVFALKTIEISDFKHLYSGQTIQTFSESNPEDYFGDRIELAAPTELRLQEDSLVIVKQHGLQEKYKALWLDGKLSIEIGGANNWKYCAEKREENELLLNTGFYIQTNHNAQRTFQVAGQEYFLRTYADIPAAQADEVAELLWVRVTYIFEQTDVTGK